MTRIAPIAGIFDVHVPDHDLRLWASFLDWCRDEKPSEVVIGGDFLELESCSQHGGVAQPAMFTQDIGAGREALAELRRANPRATLTYLEGNHESRLRRTTVALTPQMDGAVTIPEALDLPKLGIAWHKYGDVVRRGKLGFTHGWWTNEHHAAKHLRKAKESLTYGHTHRPQTFTEGSADGSVIGAFAMPCMRKLDADWVNGAPTGWVQGFGVYYVHPDGQRFNAFPVLAFEGGFVWNGVAYGDKPRASNVVQLHPKKTLIPNRRRAA
jgi:predicted phosphodiesterase